MWQAWPSFWARENEGIFECQPACKKICDEEEGKGGKIANEEEEGSVEREEDEDEDVQQDREQRLRIDPEFLKGKLAFLVVNKDNTKIRMNTMKKITKSAMEKGNYQRNPTMLGLLRNAIESMKKYRKTKKELQRVLTILDPPKTGGGFRGYWAATGGGLATIVMCALVSSSSLAN